MNKNVVLIALLLLGGVGIGFVATKLAGHSEQVTAGIIAVDASSLFHDESVVAPEDAGGDAAAQPQDAPAPAAITESVPTTPQVSQDTSGYSNQDFHFGLLFPKNLAAREYHEQGGALSVTFQDPKSNEGFQIYVTPYSGKTIDTARFRLDEPSGVMREPKEVIIGGGSTSFDKAQDKSLTAGARGTMFYGKNAIMGDTREVWFIRGGYLYEITTYKELDTWLADIMQTWKFI